MPALFLLTIGIVEFGLIMFDYHRLGEAARTGVREALIDDPIPVLTNLSGSDITCTGSGASSVSCSGASVSSSASFSSVLAAMKGVVPTLQASNLRITYRDSGITDAAVLPDVITPAVTLEVINYRYTFVFLTYIPGVPSSITLPSFASTRMVHTVVAG